MRCLFVFSILTISAITASSDNKHPRALQIAKNLEDDVANNILNENSDGIAAHFTDGFKHKECDGKMLNRARIVEKMLERKTSVPEAIFNAAEMVSDSEMYYVLDEKFASGEVLSTNVTMQNIDGQWKVTYGEVINCK